MNKLFYVCLLLLSTNAIAQKKLYIFFDTDCPICQAYTKRLSDLEREYGQSVVFEVVYPTKDVLNDIVKEFNNDYRFKLKYTLDSTHTLVQKYNATTVPEVILVNESEQILYRGSVDNQYIALGKVRPKADEFYLAEALEAVANHRLVRTTKTKPIGCLIQRNDN